MTGGEEASQQCHLRHGEGPDDLALIDRAGVIDQHAHVAGRVGPLHLILADALQPQSLAGRIAHIDIALGELTQHIGSDLEILLVLSEERHRIGQERGGEVGGDIDVPRSLRRVRHHIVGALTEESEHTALHQEREDLLTAPRGDVRHIEVLIRYVGVCLDLDVEDLALRTAHHLHHLAADGGDEDHLRAGLVVEDRTAGHYTIAYLHRQAGLQPREGCRTNAIGRPDRGGDHLLRCVACQSYVETLLDTDLLSHILSLLYVFLDFCLYCTNDTQRYLFILEKNIQLSYQSAVTHLSCTAMKDAPLRGALRHWVCGWWYGGVPAIARWRPLHNTPSAASLSRFGLGHVRKHTPFALTLSFLHLGHSARSLPKKRCFFG